MADTDDERTEEPTQQRREDFRKRGQVAQTKELASAFMLLVVAGTFWMLGRFFLQQLFEVFTVTFGDSVVRGVHDGEWLEAGGFALQKMFLLVLPLSGLFWLVGAACTLLQVGFVVNEEALQFKFDRLDPVQGLKKLFSVKSFVEGAKSVAKVTLIGTVAYFIIESELEVLPRLVTYSVEQMINFLGLISLKLFVAVGFMMFVLAGVDFFFQKWDLEKQMRMTKQEIKEEQKSREGDPMIKARIKRVQREMAKKRMMEDVPKADVIITNPTHIAIALKYDDTMVAPKVIAKGADLIAQKIREVAKEHRVPIIENKPLARAMFKTISIGSYIPRELYAAVAEVLSFVYKLKQRRSN